MVSEVSRSNSLPFDLTQDWQDYRDALLQHLNSVRMRVSAIEVEQMGTTAGG